MKLARLSHVVDIVMLFPALEYGVGRVSWWWSFRVVIHVMMVKQGRYAEGESEEDKAAAEDVQAQP
jgi:hypothetical protein